MTVEKVALGKHIDEIRERLGSNKKTVYSVTNQRGFIPALETFGKQVFSEDTSNYKVVRQDDLAFNPSRINVGSVALCPDANGGAVSPMYTIVRCRQGLLPEYLLYFLRSPIGLAEINHRTEGAVRFQLKFADLQRIPVYLPSVSEQERIVRILDEANELRRLREQTDRRTANLIPAIFHEMFGDPATNPKGWESGVLGDVIHAAQDGPHVSPQYAESGIPFLSTRNIKPGKVLWEDLKFLSPEEAATQWRKCKPQRGDVLYTKGGTTGIAAAITFDIEIAVWVHVALLKTNHKRADSIWLENMLNSSFCYKQSQELTHGIANRDLGLKRMANIQLFIPPLPLQQQFAARVMKVRALEESQAASRRKLDALFDALLHRAFRGEL